MNRQGDALPLSMAGGRNPWLIAGVVSIATFMEVLDTSIANVSLRHIAGSLAAGPDEATWVLTSYLVSNAVILPVSGWLATVVGRKRFYMGCVALFTISSCLCGLSTSLEMLIFFRVLQGIGGGGLAPSEQSMLADTFTPEKRGMAFAIYGVAVVVAPAVGPVLGGWITDNYSWHWIFLINVPVGIGSMLLSYVFLTEPPAEIEHRAEVHRRGFQVDYIGFGLVAIGLGCLQVVLDKGQREDWFGSNFIVGFSIVSATALVILVPWELTRKEPIVDLPLLKDRGFLAANVAMFAIGFILFGTTQLLPQMAQDLFGYDATLAGMVITPGGFAVMVLMPLVGFMLRKVQPRTLVAVGFVIEAFAMWRMTHLSTDADYTTLMWARVFQASGIAFLFIPISTAAYIGLPPGKNNNASALVNVFRNLGGSFGISMGQTWLAQFSQLHQSRLVEHLTPYEPIYRQALDKFSKMLGAGGPRGQVYAALNLEVQQQAAMLSYLDIFTILMWVSLGMLGTLFLMKTTKPGETAAAGH